MINKPTAINILENKNVELYRLFANKRVFNDAIDETTRLIEVSPEYVEEAYRCRESGAAMVHVHARDPRNGRPTYRAEVYAAIIAGIRKYAPELVVCASLSGRDFGEFEKRVGQRFDAVVMACHSDQSLRLLADATTSRGAHCAHRRARSVSPSPLFAGGPTRSWQN